MTLPGSGNHLVDAYEAELDREEKESKTLDCGCHKICRCDPEE